MPVIISMLRGVNVGGRNKIKIDALRSLYLSLKLKNHQTFIQSGNVIFHTQDQISLSSPNASRRPSAENSVFVLTSSSAPSPNSATRSPTPLSPPVAISIP